MMRELPQTNLAPSCGAKKSIFSLKLLASPRLPSALFGLVKRPFLVQPFSEGHRLP